MLLHQAMAHAGDLLLLEVVEQREIMALAIEPLGRSDAQVQVGEQRPDHRREVGGGQVTGAQAQRLEQSESELDRIIEIAGTLGAQVGVSRSGHLRYPLGKWTGWLVFPKSTGDLGRCVRLTRHVCVPGSEEGTSTLGMRLKSRARRLSSRKA